MEGWRRRRDEDGEDRRNISCSVEKRGGGNREQDGWRTHLNLSNNGMIVRGKIFVTNFKLL